MAKDSNLFRNREHPHVKVELVAEAQFRIGEIRQECVIYTRDARFYVRTKAEFEAKFSLASRMS